MLTKKQKKQFVKDVLKLTKIVTYKSIEIGFDEKNLFDEIQLALKAVQCEIAETNKKGIINA